MSDSIANVYEFSTAMPGILTAVAAIAGAIVGALATLLVTWVNNRSAERRHLKELIFNAAVENWKKTIDAASQQPGPQAVAPLDDYIVGLLATADLFFRRRITEENLEELLEKADRLSQKINEWRFDKSPRARGNREET